MAKLQQEPENDYDQNAVAVLINFDSGQNKLGWIAKELTSELQPLIDSGNIKVNVAHIRFRVNYLQVGYYLTINSFRTGQWSKKVVKASILDCYWMRMCTEGVGDEGWCN